MSMGDSEGGRRGNFPANSRDGLEALQRGSYMSGAGRPPLRGIDVDKILIRLRCANEGLPLSPFAAR